VDKKHRLDQERSTAGLRFSLEIIKEIIKEIIMKDKNKPKQKKLEGGAVEVMCPKCRRTEILYVPAEEVPKCPDCNVRMTIKEVLREGKSY